MPVQALKRNESSDETGEGSRAAWSPASSVTGLGTPREDRRFYPEHALIVLMLISSFCIAGMTLAA